MGEQNEGPLEAELAKAEAQLVKDNMNVARQAMVRVAELPEMRGFAHLLTGDTAVMEVASALVEQMRTSSPDAYRNGMTMADTRNELAGHLGNESSTDQLIREMGQTIVERGLMDEVRTRRLNPQGAVGQAVGVMAERKQMDVVTQGILFRHGLLNMVVPEGKVGGSQIPNLVIAEAMGKQNDYNMSQK